ncbi:MAG TPA: hydroxyacylglutathione hydrolase [Polyangiaceae bacterium]|jgi:hydroxyacylglutathione hydrolase|nr:hydroxyacylglutathione hydrolase [Polyangiaceae bacterium]
MAHAVTQPARPFRSASGALEIHQIPSAQDNLIWLIVTRDGEAAAVDGPDAGGTLDYCSANGFRLTTILNTHTHGDHIGINRDLERRGMLGGLRVVGPKRAASDVPGITEQVDDGGSVAFGGVTASVLLTEGHINGHVSYVLDGVLFCGDTMFGAGCGYLFDGPPAKMHASLERLGALPGGTRMCCAHEYTQDNLRFAFSIEPGNAELRERIQKTWALRGRGESSIPSSIGLERKTNPFLRHESPELREHIARAMPERTLATPGDVFAATRALKDRKDYKSITDAELPTG